MEQFGSRGITDSWFQSYLGKRQKIVKFKHSEKGAYKVSELKDLTFTRGGPQGSVLDTVLFVLSSSDIPEYFEEYYTTTIMHAYDTGDKIPSRTGDLITHCYGDGNSILPYQRPSNE
ncbi:hypothetical protein J6590_051058 [Homalodisca vitripennis]|nr:hypothetical protein J6590_051058 [Homalodisca vitripennis]